MARIGLISDIHSNLEALQAVLADTERVGVDRLVCLGDVVGYGPDPDACLDLVAQSCDAVVRGNHDEAVLGQEAVHAGLHPRAQEAIEFTRSRLSPGHLMLLESMLELADVDGLSLAHGSFGPRRFLYLYTARAAREAFEYLPTSIGAVGHTHVPAAFWESSSSDARLPEIRPFPLRANETVELPGRGRLILNPGSVGQPRDRNPDASWALYDSEAHTVQIRRVAYDVGAVQSKIEQMGLPDFHALRLRAGV